MMTQSIDKESVMKKWAPIIDKFGLSDDKSDWLSQYAELHQKTESGNIYNPTSSNLESLILPVVMRVAAQTIGHDIVSVKPMSSPGGISSEELERIKNDVKSENRDRKIDSLVEGKEYVEQKIEEHPDYKPGSGGLFYLDYTYGSATQSF